MVKDDLYLFNHGNTPTFVTKVREDVLDITFGFKFFEKIVTDWQVSEEPSMSDHRIITFKIEGSSKTLIPTRKAKRRNWEGYRLKL